MITIEKLKKLDSEKNIPEIDFLIDNLLKFDLKTVNSLSSLKTIWKVWKNSISRS